jgi:hypothetical protein
LQESPINGVIERSPFSKTWPTRSSWHCFALLDR